MILKAAILFLVVLEQAQGACKRLTSESAVGPPRRDFPELTRKFRVPVSGREVRTRAAKRGNLLNPVQMEDFEVL